MNIDSLGPERLELLYSAGLVHNIADLYQLQKQQLIGLGSDATIQQRGAENIISALSASRDVPFERVLFALGIRYVGEVGAKKLARYFKTIDALMEASVEEISQVEDMGEVTAQAVYEWFRDEQHRATVRLLREAGLQMEAHSAASDDRLQGMTLVVSGVFEHFSRDEIKADIEKHGGKVSGSISGKTTYLVAGEKMGPEKRKKAEKLGVKIISEEEYIQMVQ